MLGLSRQEMIPLTNSKSTGITYPHIKTCYLVLNNKVKPPLKHELTHLITMLQWDYPYPKSTWMNEGLSTFMTNNCNGYSVSEINRFFMEKNQIIGIDSLTNNFYNNSEMISYHQSGQIVGYLIEEYGLERFEKLWKFEFDKFHSIYDLSFSNVLDEMEKKLLNKYPKVPKIDHDLFMKGCQ